MVRRDPEVGKNTVDLLHPAQAQRPAQEAEVALDEMEPRIVGAVRPGVAVLVESVEASAGPQVRVLKSTSSGQASKKSVSRARAVVLSSVHSSAAAVSSDKNRFFMATSLSFLRTCQTG